MKTRFTTIDLMAALQGLQNMIGIRVNNVYDIDNKTYLIKLVKPEMKGVILIESGLRIHLTDFDYPKNISPSGFSMKLRKHIKQKRLESAKQVGVDRIIDLQFGSGEVACHVIVELYDRGNIILTDWEYTILNILRPRTDKDTDVKFVVREKYPLHLARQSEPLMTVDELSQLLANVKSGENLRKVLNPKLIFGPALLDHALLQSGFPGNAQVGKQVNLPDDLPKIYAALSLAHNIFENIRTSPCRGYVILKKETKLDGQIIESYCEFEPILFEQHNREGFYKEFSTFNEAVDEFFSKIEMQKVEAKAFQQEKSAVKKLENIRKDHDQRLKTLTETQNVDKIKAELIEMNKEIVDRVIVQINSALANHLSWEEIQNLIDEAKDLGDPTASVIKTLKLETNHVILRLSNPFSQIGGESDENDETASANKNSDSSVLVDIDLNCGAYQNARNYYVHKKQSALKERKTIEASEKALKSAEVKTQELLKQVQLKTNISKSRKLFWFEKFLWFVSSDAYLVIGGRDAQQNELIVKRYLKTGDVYVHADIRGAASVVIKNRQPADPIPPKTLSEAGTMAVCYSAAWDAKVVTSAWWVGSDQVSKTAPSGEYLTTGSFMIRGKKNYLPPCQLIMGFGVMFKVDDECVARHVEARRMLQLSRQESSTTTSSSTAAAVSTAVVDEEAVNEEQIDIEDDDDSDDSANDDRVDDKDNENSAAADVFPDVAVRLKHLSVDDSKEEVSIIQIGPTRPVVKKSNIEKTSNKANIQKPTNQSSGGGQTKTGQPKRGQRAKQKKIKEKYKDQDEEERQLRLKLLGSSSSSVVRQNEQRESDKSIKPFDSEQGATNAKSASVKNRSNERIVSANVPVQPQQHPPPPDHDDDQSESTNDLPLHEPIDEDVDDDAVEEQEDAKKMTDEALTALDALTGVPFDDDLLIFAVPVCAPYTAINAFKFKVKLTPGTGKKGKATKTAIQVFLKDKTLTNWEKDLLKVLNDQDLSRNLPGKVKVSAPQLLAAKGKR